MTHKPSWAGRVTELTVEEADALVAMGVTVYRDLIIPGDPDWGRWPSWMRLPWKRKLPSEVMAYHPNIAYFFYIPKESADEQA